MRLKRRFKLVNSDASSVQADSKNVSEEANCKTSSPVKRKRQKMSLEQMDQTEKERKDEDVQGSSKDASGPINKVLQILLLISFYCIILIYISIFNFLKN